MLVQIFVSLQVEGFAAEDLLLQHIQSRLRCLKIILIRFVDVLQLHALPPETKVHLLALHLIAPDHLLQFLKLLQAVFLCLLQLAHYLVFEVHHVVVNLRHFYLRGWQLLVKLVDSLLG